MGKGKRLRTMRAASPKETHYEGVSAFWFYVLRCVAVVTMLVDHLSRVLYVAGKIGAIPCVVCYIIGRMAFPLFAFELAESFYHTKHRWKHLVYLGILALVSEIPFDMALVMTDPMKLDMETFLDVIAYQNVCFTLFFGFLMLLLCDLLDRLIHWCFFNRRQEGTCRSCAKRATGSRSTKRNRRYIGWGLSAILKVAVYLGVGLAVGFLKTDYSWYGTTLIALFAIGRGHTSSRWRAETSESETTYVSRFKLVCQGAAILWFGLTYGTSYIVFVPLWISLLLICIAQSRSVKATEDKPVSRWKLYFFRVFYPLHLALLAVIRGLLMGWRPW